MVIRLETRTQKNNRIRKLARKKRFVKIIIIVSFALMIIGINIVNEEMQKKDLIGNSNLLRLDLEGRAIDFLGKKYYLDLKSVNKYLP